MDGHARVMFPHIKGRHWTLGTVEFFPIDGGGHRAVIRHVNSLVAPSLEPGTGIVDGTQNRRHIQSFIMDHARHHHNDITPYENLAWELNAETAHNPQQCNGYDCGVMICMYMLHLAKKLPMHYTGADARVFRQRLVLSIMRGKLMF
jgi:Ulp1 family protease